jgi:hypothetical protein
MKASKIQIPTVFAVLSVVLALAIIAILFFIDKTESSLSEKKLLYMEYVEKLREVYYPASILQRRLERAADRLILFKDPNMEYVERFYTLDELSPDYVFKYRVVQEYGLTGKFRGNLTAEMIDYMVKETEKKLRRNEISFEVVKPELSPEEIYRNCRKDIMDYIENEIAIYDINYYSYRAINHLVSLFLKDLFLNASTIDGKNVESKCGCYYIATDKFMKFVEYFYKPLLDSTTTQYFEFDDEEFFKSHIPKVYYPDVYDNEYSYSIEDEDYGNEINRVMRNQIRLKNLLTSSKEVWSKFLSKLY